MTQNSPHQPNPACIMITGGGGNLARKITAHLAALPWCQRIILVDRLPVEAGGKVEAHVADLTDASDPRWIAPLAEADAVIHLAADNPFPNASWQEGCRSFDMTANLLARPPLRPRRFVFASSNHVLGGYKEIDVAPGSLGSDTPPLPGTRFLTADGFVQERAYAAAKLMGERAAFAAAAAWPGLLTCVNLRIGWCQPGENLPATITADALPPDQRDQLADSAERRSLHWFRNMWLSNADLLASMTCALTANTGAWRQGAITVNAMSDNSGMPWDLEEARDLIGYVPQDDVWRELGKD